VKGKVIDLKALGPKDPSALEGAGFAIVHHEFGSEQIPTPKGKYFGEPACSIDVPDDVQDYARGLSGREGVEPADVLAAAQKVSAKAKSLAPPEVLGISDYMCPDTCIGVAAWISVENKKLLAVARVTKSMDHLGYQQDADELAPLLKAETEKW
jgi:hypothetical protein